MFESQILELEKEIEEIKKTQNGTQSNPFYVRYFELEAKLSAFKEAEEILKNNIQTHKGNICCEGGYRLGIKKGHSEAIKEVLEIIDKREGFKYNSTASLYFLYFEGINDICDFLKAKLKDIYPLQNESKEVKGKLKEVKE